MPLDGVWEASIGVRDNPHDFRFNDPPTNTTSLVSAAGSNGTSLSGFTDATFVRDLDDQRFIGFIPTNNGTKLLALEVESSTSAPYISSGRDPVERFSGTGITTLEEQTELEFTNIVDVESTKNGKLFILDNNLVHKLNVESVLTHASALSGVG